jgi:mannose-1-phosphate guanylyltransferase
MNVMLLAAGEGTRLRPHTLSLPKPAIPFLNIPLAAYSLSFLGDLMIDNLVVNTFHLAEKIEALFQHLPHGAKQVCISSEKGQILDTGGGLKNAQKYFDSSSFAMMNADEVIIPKDPNLLRKAIETHNRSGAIASLLVMDYPGVGTKFGGVWTRGLDVLGFGKEKISGSERAWHFIGVQILSPKIFDFLPAGKPSNILYDGLTQALAQGHSVQAIPTECEWFETGNEKDFVSASVECLKHLDQKDAAGLYLEKAIRRFGQSDEIKTFGSGKVLIGANTKIAPDLQADGYSSVGAGSSITAGSTLKNSVIGSHLQLPQNTNLENKILVSL